MGAIEEDDLESLVRAAQAGDFRAFGTLVERYQKRIFYAVLRVVKDEHTADDVTQEAFLKAHQALGRLETPAHFGTWLHRIAVNKALDAHRSQRRRREQEAGGDDFSWIEAPQDPELRALTDDVAGLKSALGAALAKLPEAQRAVVELSMDPEVRHEHIAEALGIPEGTVKSRLHHARKFLIEKLRPFLELLR